MNVHAHSNSTTVILQSKQVQLLLPFLWTLKGSSSIAKTVPGSLFGAHRWSFIPLDFSTSAFALHLMVRDHTWAIF